MSKCLDTSSLLLPLHIAASCIFKTCPLISNSRELDSLVQILEYGIFAGHLVYRRSIVPTFNQPIDFKINQPDEETVEPERNDARVVGP